MKLDLTKHDVVCIDTETTGLNWWEDKIFGVAISTLDGKDFYFDTREEPQIVDLLRDQVPHIPKIVNHNLKFDVHMMMNEGIMVDCSPGRVDCTMVLACLINEHLMSFSLDNVAKKYLGTKKDDRIYDELADLFGGKPERTVQVKNFPRAPVPIMGRYAKRDTRVALELWRWQQDEIKNQELEEIVAFEQRLFPRIIQMEREGICIDVAKAEETRERLLLQFEATTKELNRMAGFEVNPNPSDSIKKLFNPQWDKKRQIWVARDGTILNSTPAGKPSIDADALQRIKDPEAALILKARKIDKARSTFIEKHVLDRQIEGRVHPNINQTKGDRGGGTEGTGTGRMSYTQPALQQIPSRDKETAAMVRPVFIPDEGHGWSYGDLDQHEFRIFIHYAKPKSMLDAYAANPDLDIHTGVAELTGLPRNPQKSGGGNAKQMNLGMVFSMGGGTLAQEMGLPYTEEYIQFQDEKEPRLILRPGEEAQEVIAEYHRQIPGVKETARRAASIAKSRGYVRTLKGRHIRFPGGKFTHKAAGLVYQGSSADLNKDNIMRLYDVVEGVGGRVLLNIHDEYSLSIPEMSEKLTKEVLRECQSVVQSRPELRVPIRIDFSKPGANWWKATEGEKWT